MSEPRTEPESRTVPDSEPEPFRSDAAVAPGEKRHIRHEVGEFDGYRARGDAWADE